MSVPDKMKLTFEVRHPGEPAAGFTGYTETVKVSVESGDPGGRDGEFAEHMQQALAEWFCGAEVRLANPKSACRGQS